MIKQQILINIIGFYEFSIYFFYILFCVFLGGHRECCESCANDIKIKTKQCPICRTFI